jgi:hypothetical protein
VEEATWKTYAEMEYIGLDPTEIKSESGKWIELAHDSVQ